MDFLTHLFSWLCGQNPSHVWSPGGVALPCCQRCTGLYAGAIAAVGLHLWTRPQVNRGFLMLHGLFLLQLVPCGLYWIAQGPILRSISGVLAGFGIVAFLINKSSSRGDETLNNLSLLTSTATKYYCGLLFTIFAVPLVATQNQTAGIALSFVVLAGALSLAGLAIRFVTRILVSGN
jgi:uncharacterized membrane protein